MNPKSTLTLLLGFALCSPNFAQEDTLDLSANVTSITINWTWQAQNGDTTTRDFCLLEFALPMETLSGAYCFKLGGIQVSDGQGRVYQASAFAVSAGEQSLQRDYRLLQQKDGKAAAPRFRVRIEKPQKDIEYFRLAAQLDAVFLSGDANSTQEYSTLDWQSLYEELLPYNIQMVFAAQSRSMMEQMANLGGMSPEGQESLNVFMENSSMFLQEPLFPESTNFLLKDPDKRVLKVETIGVDGQPIPYKERRSYTGGILYLQQQYEIPLSGQERVRVLVATDEARRSVPIKMEKVRLPW